MKKIISFAIAGAFAISSLSCQTTYDAYGNPRQTVDPGTAAAGVAAAGVLGYALSRDRNKHNRRNAYRHGYYNGRTHGYYDRRGHYHRY